MADADTFIPAAFADGIIAWRQDEGAAWLARLPAIVAACAEHWSLRVAPPFEPLFYNYVAPAVRADGTAAVLKIGLSHPEVFTEMEALRLFDGRGIIRLLEKDRGQGAFLVERLEPGTPLASLADDAEATRIAARTMRQLWRTAPAGHLFPSLARYTQGLDEYRLRFPRDGPLPDALVDAAIRMRDELLASATEELLLHGDCHHYNILTARRQPWLAIDPKGVVGDPGYETGPLQINPFQRLLKMPEPRRIMARRIAALAEELGFEPGRVWAWGFVHAVLSACWSSEYGERQWEYAIACAENLAAIR